MARPRSTEKRKAILEAALTIFAERGFWSTPTSEISEAAGVAEGTLFTYFKTKDILMNELYRELKQDLSAAVQGTTPLKGDAHDRLLQLWTRYVGWGVNNPEKIKVLTQLNLSDSITEESKKFGQELFFEFEKVMRECAERNMLRDNSQEFVEAMMTSMTETTIALILKEKSRRDDYCRAGFEALWNFLVKS